MHPERMPRREAGDLAGLTERQLWSLSLIAHHGDLNTQQVATLMFDSRPAAARDLGTLTKAGLLVRYVFPGTPAIWATTGSVPRASSC